MCGFLFLYNFVIMRFILAATVLALALSSCSSSNSFPFGMYSKYQLRKGEVHHFPIPQEKVDEYEACCWMDEQNIFLNRTLTYGAGSHRIFIGAGELTSRGDFNRAQAEMPQYEVIEQKRFTGKKVSYEAHRVFKDPYYLVRVNYDEPKSGLFMLVDHVFSDEALSKAYYDSIETTLEDYLLVK